MFVTAIAKMNARSKACLGCKIVSLSPIRGERLCEAVEARLADWCGDATRQ